MDFNQRSDKKHYLIVENGQNTTLITRSNQAHGYEIDAQWMDDFHHAMHAFITGEQNGYYIDFADKPVNFELRNHWNVIFDTQKTDAAFDREAIHKQQRINGTCIINPYQLLVFERNNEVEER